MATQQINIKRGGKVKTATIGIDAGKSKLSLINELNDPTHNQPIKTAPVRLIIDFDESELNGEVIKIQTFWKTAMVSNTGKPIHATGLKVDMFTNADDIKGFVAMFGNSILISMLNGYVRSIEGFNDKPVFYSSDVLNTDGTVKHKAGTVILYTPAQESEPPKAKGEPGSYDYIAPATDGSNTANP